jgi:hypothetical protein
MVAQCIQQGHVGVGVDRALPAIDVENDVLRHGAPPCVLTDLRWRVLLAFPM